MIFIPKIVFAKFPNSIQQIMSASRIVLLLATFSVSLSFDLTSTGIDLVIRHFNMSNVVWIYCDVNLTLFKRMNNPGSKLHTGSTKVTSNLDLGPGSLVICADHSERELLVRQSSRIGLDKPSIVMTTDASFSLRTFVNQQVFYFDYFRGSVEERYVIDGREVRRGLAHVQRQDYTLRILGEERFAVRRSDLYGTRDGIQHIIYFVDLYEITLLNCSL